MNAYLEEVPALESVEPVYVPADGGAKPDVKDDQDRLDVLSSVDEDDDRDEDDDWDEDDEDWDGEDLDGDDLDDDDDDDLWDDDDDDEPSLSSRFRSVVKPKGTDLRKRPARRGYSDDSNRNNK